MKKMSLSEAIEKMLLISKARLERAKTKKNKWEIDLYTGAIKRLESQLSGLN